MVGMYLEDELQQQGFDVQWVVSAAGALAAIDRGQPDVAVLDVVMRGEPCTALAVELKRRDIPFVIYSGWTRREQSPAFQDAPWVIKPVDPAVLAETLNAALRISRDSLTRHPGRSDQTRQPLPAQGDRGWSDDLGSNERDRPSAALAEHD